MKLYKITRPSHIIFDKDGDSEIKAAIAWRGTATDARKIRIELEAPLKEIKPAKRPKVDVEEVEVPTAKVGLLEWLNANAV